MNIKRFGIWILFGFWILSFGFSSVAYAMGEKPPTPEAKSKYKLKVLKMEIIPASQANLTTFSVKKLSNKKALLIIAPKNFQDEEYTKIKNILESAGVKVTVAASSTKIAQGMYAKKVTPTLNIKDAKATDYDTIIFIGGTGSTIYKSDPFAHSLAIESVKNKKVLGAICLAPTILAKAGIMNNKKATVSPAGIHILKKAGANYTGKMVTVDGNIITGSGPKASTAFGNAILDALKSRRTFNV